VSESGGLWVATGLKQRPSRISHLESPPDLTPYRITRRREFDSFYGLASEPTGATDCLEIWLKQTFPESIGYIAERL